MVLWLARCSLRVHGTCRGLCASRHSTSFHARSLYDHLVDLRQQGRVMSVQDAWTVTEHLACMVAACERAGILHG